MPDDLAPNLKPSGAALPLLPEVTLKLVEATPETLKGYGELVDDKDQRPIEIVRWPALGRRPVDPGTGDQGDMRPERRPAGDAHVASASAAVPPGQRRRPLQAVRQPRLNRLPLRVHPSVLRKAIPQNPRIFAAASL